MVDINSQKKITSKEDLLAWFESLEKSQRKDAAAAIAHRCAIRVFPRVRFKEKSIYYGYILRCLIAKYTAAAYAADAAYAVAYVAYAVADASDAADAAYVAYAVAADAAAAADAVAAYAYAVADASDAADAAADAVAGGGSIGIPIWSEVSIDVDFWQEHGHLNIPVWHEGMPDEMQEKWTELENILLNIDKNNDIWINFYTAELKGKKYFPQAVLNKIQENLHTKEWKKGFSHINPKIKQWMDKGRKEQFSKVVKLSYKLVLNDERQIDIEDEQESEDLDKLVRIFADRILALITHEDGSISNAYAGEQMDNIKKIAQQLKDEGIEGLGVSASNFLVFNIDMHSKSFTEGVERSGEKISDFPAVNIIIENCGYLMRKLGFAELKQNAESITDVDEKDIRKTSAIYAELQKQYDKFSPKSQNFIKTAFEQALNVNKIAKKIGIYIIVEFLIKLLENVVGVPIPSELREFINDFLNIVIPFK